MQIQDTLTRSNQEIRSLNGKQIKLYTCGLTVYSQPHIGNWVAYIYWDVLVRTLKDAGYDVTRVQNITDVGHLTSDEDAGEDKMLKGALKEGLTAWQVAEKYISIADDEAYNQLGLLRPDYMPRATDYIPHQIAFVQELEHKGFTYVIDDGVYFDTSMLKNYGELARLDIDGLQFGARVEDTGKKNPTDFAVWKFSNPAEKRDMEWESPWGTGFPGWHLECSVMAREILGDQIDIHAGGIDHIPVHHINEIAQTEAITGQQFSQYWVHSNHIKVNGEKMSKSLGNIYTLNDITSKGFELQAFKIMVLSKQYGTEGNFTWEILEAAQNRLNHWQEIADLRWQYKQKAETETIETSDFVSELQNVLQNNIDTPAALAVIDASFNFYESEHISPTKEFLEKIMDTLGINLLLPDISDEQKSTLSQRQVARNNQDWSESDRLRNELLLQGIRINDTSTGQIWSRIQNK